MRRAAALTTLPSLAQPNNASPAVETKQIETFKPPTPAPAYANRETEWTYNEEGDEEELFGFKKEYFYNNHNFYSKYS